MATKTITIDMEAYQRLKEAKKKEESFSQAIKRIVPRRFDWEAWLADIARNPLSDEALEAIEAQVQNRRRRTRRVR